jgi:peptidyl-prolyl cis-trans isomerase A (cyclophilin A)
MILTALFAAWLSVAAPPPDVYQVKFETSVGDFVVEVHREWAPLGAARFHDLVAAKYYDEGRFFRVVKGFMVQFGLNGTPAVSEKWSRMPLKDDPVKESNVKGAITFAMAGPNTRTTQVFINLVDNTRLDAMGFAPFGRVLSGMDVVEKLYSQYGDAPPNGEGPDQGKIRAQGNAYLEGRFPKLDYTKKATILQ